MEFITAELTPWHWLTLGALLLAIELFAPTTFLLWPAIAAIATGILVWIIPALSWHLQLALFAALAVVAILLGRHFFKSKNAESTHPTLNRRGESVKGRIVTLTAPIENGIGSAMIDNTRWRLIGPDMPAGTTLRVTGTDGSSLTVEEKIDEPKN